MTGWNRTETGPTETKVQFKNPQTRRIIMFLLISCQMAMSVPVGRAKMVASVWISRMGLNANVGEDLPARLVNTVRFDETSV